MNYEHPFVQEVRANPRDDAPRLIFADYLEEIGDPRGELIRLQVELANLGPGAPARRELELRVDELLAEFAELWLEPLRQLGAEGVSARCFKRGLIERVRMKAETFLAHGEQVCRIAPGLHWIELHTLGDSLPKLLASQLPDQITAIDLSANRLENVTTDEQVINSSWPDQLESLVLAFNRLTLPAVLRLVQRPWPRLTSLNLSVNQLTVASTAGTPPLITSPPFPHLESLQLTGNPLTSAGLLQLLQVLQLPNLRELDVATTRIDASGLSGIAQYLPLDRLERLVLRGNRLGDSYARPLERIMDRAPLKHLDVRNTGMDPEKLPRQKLGEGLVR